VGTPWNRLYLSIKKDSINNYYILKIEVSSPALKGDIISINNSTASTNQQSSNRLIFKSFSYFSQRAFPFWRISSNWATKSYTL